MAKQRPGLKVVIGNANRPMSKVIDIPMGAPFFYREAVYIRVQPKRCYIKKAYENRVFVLDIASGYVQTMYVENRVQPMHGEFTVSLI